MFIVHVVPFVPLAHPGELGVSPIVSFTEVGPVNAIVIPLVDGETKCPRRWCLRRGT